MKTILISVLLVLVASAVATKCGQGGVLCPGGQCHFPQYIEGCSIYSS